jgi:putative hydrolase of the HAD superfamily
MNRLLSPRVAAMMHGMSTNRRYRCIAFDAVGTLIHPTPPPGEVYFQVGRRFGSQLSADDIGRRFKKAFRDSERADFLGVSGPLLATSEALEKERWRQIVAAVIDDIADNNGCFAELFAHFASPGSWSCFDDVPGVLAALHAAGYRLAIASNFDSRLHAVSDSLTALKAIDLRVISSGVGCRKPGRAFFEALVAGAGCAAHEVLMVGDDPVNDVEGARDAGLGAVLLNRHGHRERGEIGSLLELGEILAHGVFS